MSSHLNGNVRYHNYLELFFKQAEDSISVFDLNNRILTCNPSFEKLYGWTLDECIGQPIQFFPETERKNVQKRCMLLSQGETLSHVQTTEKRKDGSLFYAEITMTPIFNEQDEIVAVSQVTRDITARLQQEQNKLDSERLQTISMVAASVAHEVRNPMTSITGFIQMMNHDGKNPYSLFTKIMEKEINRINDIVSDFLALAQPAVQNAEILSIRSVFEELLAEFYDDFTNRMIRCHLELKADDFGICGSRSSLRTAFHNIISNSRDAIASDGHITITISSADRLLCICIDDSGCGIDSSHLESIYQPFFSTKENGTGLGMNIAEKIIVDHKGTLKVESLKSAGTKVTIQLPLADEPLD